METTNTPPTSPADAEACWAIAAARAPRIRTMREFAESEIVLPTGPFAGLGFRCDRQPYTGVFFDAVDSALRRRWNRICATGPTQSGKTLAAFAVPILYHLFEMGETVVAGVPHMDTAGDKWRQDLLPVIKASPRLREQLPRRGAASRGGGKIESITFRNGATLRFMSGGGGDKSRASFTTRVLVVTETDGFDEHGGTSHEADKFTQIEARTRAFGDRKRVYMECTTTVEKGRTWREYTAGTASRIFLCCPHCRVWVSPGRGDFLGFETATTEAEAEAAGSWYCPDCGEEWTDTDRQVANLAGGRLVHRGQEIDADGRVTGDAPETRTLGFRWSPINNLFVSSSDLALDSFKAQHADDQDNAEREMCQFVWAVPYESPDREETPLDRTEVAQRRGRFEQNILPPDVARLVAHVDIGKWQSWHVATARTAAGVFHVPDYGVLEVHSDNLPTDRAIVASLRTYRDRLEAGYIVEGSGGRRHVDRVTIDAGWQTDAVFEFCRESNAREGPTVYVPAIGRGASQMRRTERRVYQSPNAKTREIRKIGRGWHQRRVRKYRADRVTVDADHWKRTMQQALAIAAGSPGSIIFFDDPDPNRHQKISRHVTAERLVKKTVPGRGEVEEWEQHGPNHLGDCLYNTLASLDYLETDGAAAPTSWFDQRKKKKGGRR